MEESILDDDLYDGQTLKTEPELVLATNEKRFLNYILDSIAAFVFMFLCLTATFATGILDADSEDDEPLTTLMVYGIYFLYYVLIEMISGGKSFGKLITKTKVVTLDGGKPTLGQFLGRSAARFIPFEPFSFFGTPGKGWHDSLSKTLVIDEQKSRLSPLFNDDDHIIDAQSDW